MLEEIYMFEFRVSSSKQGPLEGRSETWKNS